MIKGTRYNFQIGYHSESGVLKELVAEVNLGDGTEKKSHPRMILGKSTAIVVVKLDNRACMETVGNFDVYSRIQMIYEGSPVAFGKIIELMD